jgi:hypothetical protein
LVEKVPPGQLNSPYPDYANLAKQEDLVKVSDSPAAMNVMAEAETAAFARL